MRIKIEQAPDGLLVTEVEGERVEFKSETKMLRYLFWRAIILENNDECMVTVKGLVKLMNDKDIGDKEFRIALVNVCRYRLVEVTTEREIAGAIEVAVNKLDKLCQELKDSTM